MCDKLRKKPTAVWTNTLDAYTDNRKWTVPRGVKGAAHLRRLKVRGHLRTKAEGLDEGFTKPDARKHRVNVGPSTIVFAAIVGRKVRVWHYLPRKWSGEAAANAYEKQLAPALRRHRGQKRVYRILEDNDPTGYKSARGMDAKRKSKIEPIPFPTYSPDLNPCDFALWDEVERRMDSSPAPAGETVDAYLARLRRTALSLPEAVVRKMLAAMKHRTQEVYDREGGHIPRD